MKERRRMRWMALVGGRVGVLLLVVGMALWILGVLIPLVLLPGIYLAAFSLLVLSVAGVAWVSFPVADGAAVEEDGA